MSTSARIVWAYSVLCIVWGSTYLAIRIGVHHLPPALLGGIRFVIAGSLLVLLARRMGDRLPTAAADYRANAIVGALLLTGANGLVMWAEQFVTAGVASIFVVTVALWMAVLDAVIPGSTSRPTPTQFVALFAGFAGTILLVGTSVEELRAADWRGPVALTIASMLWAAGSIYSQRRAPRTSGPYMNSALQQLSGGILLLIIATATGEWSRASFSWPGAAAVAYLIVFGSIAGFTAFVYVLRNMSATMAGTYVYANTVVAVFLGWALLGEPVAGRTFLAMSIVMGAVVWVRAARRRPEPERDLQAPRRASSDVRHSAAGNTSVIGLLTEDPDQAGPPHG